MCDFLKIERKFENVNRVIEETITKYNYTDPFYVVNLDKCFLRYKLWNQYLPRVKAHYAIKANNDTMISRLYAHLGLGFDCASEKEIEQVLAMGVSPDRIIYAHPCKEKKSLRKAFEIGVNKMTFDNEHELYKIKDEHSNAQCLVRIKTNDANAKWALSAKFGADINTARHLIDTAKLMNIRLIGVAFHVGCSNSKPSFDEEIEKCRILFDYARQIHGIEMSVVDIGGGYPGIDEDNDIFRQTAQIINEALDKHFPNELFPNVKFIAEPGRFLCETALTICTRIIAKNTINESLSVQVNGEDGNNQKLSIDKSKSFMYYLNCGFYSGLMYMDPRNIPKLLSVKSNENFDDKSSIKNLYLTTLWGPTCDALDVVIKNKYFPEYQIDDYLVFNDMGAYTNTIVTHFNSLPTPNFVYAAFECYDEYKEAF